MVNMLFLKPVSGFLETFLERERVKSLVLKIFENIIHSSLENQGKSRTHFWEPGTNLSLGAKNKPTVLINVHPQQIYK